VKDPRLSGPALRRVWQPNCYDMQSQHIAYSKSDAKIIKLVG